MARSRTAFLPLLLALLAAMPLGGQVATVRVEENFRMEPNGTILARLLPGTTASVDGRQGDWLEVTVEGWVWTRSLQATERGGFDLVVSAEEGENLRAGPQGAVLARLEPGTLLAEEERTPGWIRVTRRGWIWAASMDVVSEAARPAPTGAGGPDPAPASSSARPPSADAPDGAAGFATSPAGGLAVLAAPDGDTLARTGPGTDLQVVERRGSWARVRLEGWAWLPAGAPSGDRGTGPADATPDQVRAAPARWLGRLVSWELQYVSLERAERVRTDFFEGEPFLLTRPPGGRGPFVYVAVPPDRMAEVEGLTPLERIRVTGRIRTGASSLTGSPILDLVELRRLGR